MLSAWRERLQQFLAAGSPAAVPLDVRVVDAYLTSAERRLFLRQGAYEQRHAVRQTRALLALVPDAPRSLVAATLLHDLGKAQADVRRWQRVAFVLLSAFVPWVWHALPAPSALSNRYAFWVLRRHAQLGADLACREGVERRVVWLVRHHHDHLDDADLRLLQRVDEIPSSRTLRRV